MTDRSDLADRVATYCGRARQLQKLSAGRRRLRRGAVYASAAGAALAGASAAEADIVWSGDQSANPNAMVSITSSANLDVIKALTGTSVGPLPVDLQIRVRRYVVGADYTQLAAVSGLNGLKFAANPFPYGSPITGSFNAGFRNLARYTILNAFYQLFPPSQNAFLGFQTASGDKGWIKLHWEDATSSPYPVKVSALEWAIEDLGGSINAGQTAVPEASAAALMSLVACGCAGVVTLKKLRRAG
jgi:hypothetical protein